MNNSGKLLQQHVPWTDLVTRDDGPTYSYAGEEVPLNLLDLLYEYLQAFKDAGVPEKQYKPFLKALLQELTETKNTKSKKALARRKCQNFLDQWERVAL